MILLAFVAALLFVLWRRRRAQAKASQIGIGVALGMSQARTFFSPYRLPGRRGSKRITGGF